LLLPGLLPSDMGTTDDRDVSGVVRYSPEQMFAVVAAVDLYEDFVPWCQRSRIIRRYDDGSFDAELEIGFKFLVESYVSHVEMEKFNYIKVRTV
jgi:coenzyme Q-binding protein COQ10